MDRLLTDVRDGVGRITFNDPQRRNSLSLAMCAAIVDALARFDADPAIRVIVITGAGEDAFMSGADIREQNDPATSERLTVAVRETVAALGAVRIPMIAMIRGYCLGGGLAAALQADMRFAADGSLLGIPATRLGVGYPFDGIRRLVGLVGPAAASDVMFSGRRLSTAEALHIGLIDRACPGSELESRVDEMASMIAANAPLSLLAAKAAIRATQDPDADLEEVDRLAAAAWASEDLKEGQRAFLEKRAPRFQGR